VTSFTSDRDLTHYCDDPRLSPGFVTINQVPNMVAAWLENLSQSPLMVMILFSAFSLLLGHVHGKNHCYLSSSRRRSSFRAHVGMGFDPLVYGVVLIINLIIRLRLLAVAVGIYTAMPDR